MKITESQLCKIIKEGDVERDLFHRYNQPKDTTQKHHSYQHKLKLMSIVSVALREADYALQDVVDYEQKTGDSGYAKEIEALDKKVMEVIDELDNHIDAVKAMT